MMASPFPGMDPWLEAPAIWPDLHDRLATSISDELNLGLPQPYYARLEMRPEVGIAEEEGVRRRIVPDVSVVEPPFEQGGLATQSPPRWQVSPSHFLRARLEPIRHHYIEIRDAGAEHRLITLIEIVSPANKRPGPDRAAFRAKQNEVLGSEANWIEIDLLRSGKRLFPAPHLIGYIDSIQPRPDYLVTVSRWWERLGLETNYQLFTWTLRDSLPCIGIPLKQGEDEVPLDLQHVFGRCYDTGPYRRGAVNYAKPPDPPLSDEDAAWAQECLRAYGLLSA